MVLLKKIVNWFKYSKEREHLTIYERRILRKSSNTKCPHCKHDSIHRNHNNPYMSMTYYCDICGFAFAEEMFTVEYRNHGYKLHKIDQQKVRVAKIKRLLSKQKKV